MDIWMHSSAPDRSLKLPTTWLYACHMPAVARLSACGRRGGGGRPGRALDVFAARHAAGRRGARALRGAQL